MINWHEITKYAVKKHPHGTTVKVFRWVSKNKLCYGMFLRDYDLKSHLRLNSEAVDYD